MADRKALFFGRKRPFVITVKTDNLSTGSSLDNQFTIPTRTIPGYPYNYDIRTSDGQEILNVTGSYTVTFPSPGTYDIKIYENFPTIYFNGTGDRLKILEIKAWGTVRWHSFSSSFYLCTNLNCPNVVDIPLFHNAGIRDIMANAFRGCTSLANIKNLNDWDLSQNNNLTYTFGQNLKPFNENVGNWNVSNVQFFTRCFDQCNLFNNMGSPSINNWQIKTSGGLVNFNALFGGCASFNQPLNNWNTSNVNNFSEMFYGCSIFNQNLSSWNTANATTFYWFFWRATVFNNGGDPGINNWNTSNVTNTQGMFQQCQFNQPIGLWDMSKVTTMASMFYIAPNFNQNISAWNTSNVLTFEGTFLSATSFNNGGDPGINNWNVSKCTNFNNMFNSCTAFNQPIGDWDFITTSPFTMVSMMNTCRIFNQNLSAWNLNRCTTLSNTFANCWVYNNGGDPGIANWDVQNVTTLVNTFNNCREFNQPLTNWNTTNVNSLFGTFTAAWIFDQPLSTWNISNVTTTSYTFSDAFVFNQNLSSWNMGNVTNMSYMFRNAYKFNNDGDSGINGWNTNKVTTLQNTFTQCREFNQPLNSWDVSKVTTLWETFAATWVFNQPLNLWNTSLVTTFYSTFNNAFVFNQNLGSWVVTASTSFENMFWRAYQFNNGGSADINNWVIKTNAPVNMRGLFYETAFNQPIGNWNTSQVTTIATMFYGGIQFNQDISTWDVSNMTDMGQWCYHGFGTSIFNQNLGSWSPLKCTNFSNFLGFVNAGMSNANMDNLYNGWSDKKLLPSVTLSLGTKKYTAAGLQGRSLLSRPNVTISITNAVNNGSGLIRISATAHGLTTGNKAFIYDVLGTTEANGPWIVTVVDANTIDLDGSTFTNAYTSGGTLRTGYGWTITDGGI